MTIKNCLRAVVFVLILALVILRGGTSTFASPNPTLSGTLTLHFALHPDDPLTPEVNESFWFYNGHSGGISLSVPSVFDITTTGGGNLNWSNPGNWTAFPLDLGGLVITHTGSGSYTRTINNGQVHLNVLQGNGPSESTVQTNVAFSNITMGSDFTILSNVANTRYNVTLPTGAHMNFDLIPTLQNLTLNSGASVNNGGFSITVRQNLTNHGSGDFNAVIQGNLINDALSSGGNVADARFIILDGQLQNTGELNIPGQLRTNAATGNSGTVRLNGGSFYPQAAFVNNGTFLFSAGGLYGPGVVTNNGTFDWSGDGNLDGSVVNTTNSFTISGTTTRRLLGTLTNQGTIKQSGGHALSFSATGILNNQAGALFDVLDDSTMFDGSGGIGTINNVGTFRKSGGSGVSTLAPAFNNTGAIVVSSGTLRLLGGGMLHGGTMSVSNGGSIRLGNGNFDAQGVLSVSGNGTLEVAAIGNTSVIVANGNSVSFANFTGGADLVLTGGQLRADAGGALTLNLTGASSVELTGPSGSGGGYIGGQGTTTNLGNFAWSLGSVVGNLRNESANFTIIGPDSHRIDGGHLTNAATITHSDDGELRLSLGGTFVNEVGALYDITGDGDIAAGQAIDTVTNAGTLRKSGGAGISLITTPLTNTGTIAIESGTLLLAGPDVLTLHDSGTLAFALGGSTPAVDYGKLDVQSTLTLDGQLRLTLEAGYAPAPGTSYDILDWTTQGSNFVFDVLNLPGGGLTWDTTLLYTEGKLTVGGLLGDYNLNGHVDAADYVVWRNSRGQSGINLRADIDGDRQVTVLDYVGWKAHYGETSGEGSGTSVPEPTTLALFMVVLIATASARGRNVAGTLRVP